MDPHRPRLAAHSSLAARLSSQTDAQLESLLAGATPLHAGIGGTSLLLTLDDSRVFVKRVPLTDLERQPGNLHSTANLFALPTHYQYGIGSAGFGAWRELAAHALTTGWALSGECPSFPLLRHSRILPTEPALTTTEQLGQLERDVSFWEGSPGIRRRLEALQQVSAHLVLFLEWFPQNLGEWLKAQLAAGDESAERAVLFVDDSLRRASAQLEGRGFVHFDAHFANVLTDGRSLALGDLGLALSSSFALSPDERAFLEQHHDYDRCTAAVSLVHAIVTAFRSESAWRDAREETLRELPRQLPPALRAVLERHATVTLAMTSFFKKLRTESMRTPYPRAELDALLARGGL